MIDGGEADDKIVAVLSGDPVWDNVTDIADLPPALVARMEHYFLSYKTIPGKPETVTIPMTYGAEHAQMVVTAAMADYEDTFGDG
jgi:inorganic pyrophosphatase